MKFICLLKFRRSQLLFIILLQISFCQSFGQDVISKIDQNDLRAFIKTLSSIQFEGRSVDNDGQIKTQEFIIDRFKTLQLEPFSYDGYLEKFTLNQTDKGEIYLQTHQSEQVGKTIETANVIGMIRGESDQSIILSAHYDHVGKDENEYYPGADDNASGVAALLELAEEFAQYKNLKYTMIFLATSAEESGLLGSSYHVNHPGFEPERVICNINMDMISRCDSEQADCDYLYFISDNRSEALDSLVREADKLFPECTLDYSDSYSYIFFRTDTYNFSKKGIPSILFFAGFHDDYHKPTDTMDKIDFDILENRIKLICEVIKLLQNNTIEKK